MVVVSFGCMHLVTTQMTKKAPPKTSFSEREFQQYEQETGLKRRSKLVSHEKNDLYTFYMVPYAANVAQLAQRVHSVLPEHKQVKVIDPAALVAKELEDRGRYSYLLEEVRATGQAMPRGLVTALVKQEVELFMNTTRGQHATNVILANYPQTTEEAIKFENEVSDVEACLVLDNGDLGALGDDQVRKVNNVIGYFDIVDKVKRL